ncbi:MAG: hypothetical protein AABW92_03410 [Nanoarchaeota archaeon]
MNKNTNNESNLEKLVGKTIVGVEELVVSITTYNHDLELISEHAYTTEDIKEKLVGKYGDGISYIYLGGNTTMGRYQNHDYSIYLVLKKI